MIFRNLILFGCCQGQRLAAATKKKGRGNELYSRQYVDLCSNARPGPVRSPRVCRLLRLCAVTVCCRCVLFAVCCGCVICDVTVYCGCVLFVV